MAPSSAEVSPGSAFPRVPQRYRIDRFRGRGGTGSVYEAWDHDLGRKVALKFLSNDGPEERARAVRQARAQARITHPDVCQVFDVVDDHERLFISMQWSGGETLDIVAKNLSLRQKVVLVRDAARAVHAAHVQQVLHRDVKPSNILVERQDDGSLKVVVIDFGLARSADDPRLTATGEIVGTPNYLAPEQVWGEAADHRTDVWALGATLYHVLAGKPPFVGSSATDVMIQVATRAVPPIRRVEPSVPRQLATIVETALANDRKRRYASAQAFADDLDRWLGDQPIAARRPSFAFRAGLWVRRHRNVALAAMAAGIVTAGTAAAHIATLRHDREVRDVTARLEERVRQFEKLIAHDRAMPLHDTRPAVARIRKEIDELKGDPAYARFTVPLAYAEGRARLAAGDDAAAANLLGYAWRHGLRSPAVGYHLGVALSAEYARSLTEAERIAAPELRSRRIAQIHAQYREAALGPMSAARGYVDEPAALIEARIALVEGDTGRAARLAAGVARQVPWNNAARLLVAEAQTRAARAHRLEGRFSEALALFEQASQATGEALLTARSDPRALDTRCQTATGLLQVAGDTGGDEEAAFERARTACEAALVADPDRLSSLLALSSGWTRIAFYRGRSGRRDAAADRNAVETAERALRISPDSSAALMQAGAAYYWLPLDHAPRVADYMRRAVAADPESVDARHGLGRSLLRLSDHMQRHQQDPTATLEEAIHHLDEVLRRVPHHLPAVTSTAFALNHLADLAFRQGSGAETRYRQMLAVVEPRLAKHPQAASLRYLAGLAWWGLGRERFMRREPATDELRRAEALFSEAIRLNPQYLLAWAMRAQARTLASRADRSTAGAKASLAAAEEDLERISGLDSRFFYRANWYVAAAATETDWIGALRRLDRAESELEEFVSMSPDNATWAVHLERARIQGMRCRIDPRACDRTAFEQHLALAGARNPLIRREAEATELRLERGG